MSSIRETAEGIAAPTIGKVAPAVYREIVADIEQALRNRDERAVAKIEDHRLRDVCHDNCWTTIKAAIRKDD